MAQDPKSRLLQRLIPQYQYWGQRWRAQLFAAVLFFGMLLTLTPLAVELARHPELRPDLKLLIGILVFEIAVWALWRLRGLEAATTLFVVGSTVIVLEALLLSGGISGPLAFPQLFVVIVAALLTSPKMTLGVIGTMASFNLGLFYITSIGKLPPSILDESLVARFSIQFSILALSAATILYSNRIRLRLTQQISANELKFRALFEKTSDAVFLIGLDQHLIEVNAQAANLLGYRAYELEGIDIKKLFPASEWNQVKERLMAVPTDRVLEPTERRFLTKSGQEVILETNLALIEDENGNLLHYQSIGRDITSKVLEEQRIRSTLAHMTVRANTDALTGVLNREATMQHARAEWDRYMREETPMSVMLVDMDGLKTINDTHGHLVGDTALKTLAQVLEQNKRPYDWIGRFGGDEFMVVLPGASWVDTQEISNRMLRAVDGQHIRTAGAQVNLRASVGVASTDDPETRAQSINELLNMADVELYRAKRGAQRNRPQLFQ